MTEKLDFNFAVDSICVGALIYRLSISERRNQFLLKGALLFDLWFEIPHRPTHDAGTQDQRRKEMAMEAQRKSEGLPASVTFTWPSAMT